MTVLSLPGNGVVAAARRTELAAFLRACRARITAEDVGLPPGLRRRTPGLRREEVAQLAGVGVTWYTWLEQGRPINASEQVLEAIARTLRLDVAERDHLYRLAEVVPPPAVYGCPIEPETQTILDALNPLPAAVVSARYDLLRWNAAYAALFADVLSIGGLRNNVMWCLFTLPACCNPFVNRAQEIPWMVAVLRAAYGRHVGEPDWEAFVRDLSAASPEFAQLWARQEVATPSTRMKVFRHSTAGVVHVTTTSLALSAAPEARFVIYTPTDDESRQRLEWLAAHPDAPKADHTHIS